MLNWKGFERAIEMGYRYTLERLDRVSSVALGNAPRPSEGWGRIP
jgi:hypothetical protein